MRAGRQTCIRVVEHYNWYRYQRLRLWNGAMVWALRLGAVVIVVLLWASTTYGAPRPHCDSIEIAQRGDSTFYETVCLGGAKP